MQLDDAKNLQHESIENSEISQKKNSISIWFTRDFPIKIDVINKEI